MYVKYLSVWIHALFKQFINIDIGVKMNFSSWYMNLIYLYLYMNYKFYMFHPTYTFILSYCIVKYDKYYI